MQFPGFSQKSRKFVRRVIKKLGVPKQGVKRITENAKTFRETAVGLKNLIAASKNVTTSTEKLNKILNERIKNVLAVDYKIIDDNTGIFNGYVPTAENIKEWQKY